MTINTDEIFAEMRLASRIDRMRRSHRRIALVSGLIFYLTIVMALLAVGVILRLAH